MVFPPFKKVPVRRGEFPLSSRSFVKRRKVGNEDNTSERRDVAALIHHSRHQAIACSLGAGQDISREAKVRLLGDNCIEPLSADLVGILA